MEGLVGGLNGSAIPMEGDRLLLSCPAGCGARRNREESIGGKTYAGPQPLWGWNDVFGGNSENVYAPQSSLCRAAVHAGLASSQVSSCFSLKAAPPLFFYQGSTRNGVSSFGLDLSDSPVEGEMLSAKLQHSPAICPFALYRYTACLFVPITVALALLAPPPFLFWLATVAVAYWFEALLGADPWNTHHGTAGGGRDPDGGGGLTPPWTRFFSCLCFSPAVYLMGPAYVLKAPCWQRHLPPVNRLGRSISARGRDDRELPPPAVSIKELLVRNILCFFLPMLIGCRIESALHQTLLAGVSTTFSENGLAKGENDPVYLLTPFVVISALSVLRSFGVGWRLADIVKYCWVTAALALCLWLCTVLLRGYKILTLGHFWLISNLIPVFARDHHAAAACQGVLLGMVIQCLYIGEGISPWTYASPPNF